MVVDYPTVSREDFDWVQSIRAEHDELYYEVADPHLAFVFPVFDFDRERFLERVKGYTRGVERISFVCRCAAVVKDATNEYAHVFLVPDEGHSEIIKLHDRLYEGPCPLTCGWTSTSSSHRRRERDRPEGLESHRGRAQPRGVRDWGLRRRAYCSEL